MLSVVVSTYNQNAALCLILESLRRQTSQDFEVVVANDGGDREGVQAVVDVAANFIPVRHEYLEPPTEVYRACEVRNAGLFASRGDRVLFIDGDSIPCDRTVEIHSEYGDRPIAVQSNRAMIPRNYAADATIDNLESLVARRRFPPSGSLELPLRWPDVWTYSASYPAEVVKAIGGFWEAMQGHFGNDVELNARLNKIAFKFAVRLDSTSYHLGHERPWENDKSREEQQAKLKESRAIPTIFRERSK